MLLTSRRFRQALTLTASVALIVSVAACGAGKKTTTATSGPGAAASGKPITVGTTDPVVALDPAGSYDFGSLVLEDSLYQFLLNVPAGGKAPQPDAAKSCAFIQPTEYSCTLRPGLKFSNGDPLTAVDVAFSFNRVVKINDPNGPASLLANMTGVTASSDSIVVFKLKNPNDQTFPFVLGTSAGPIVDSKRFPADKLLDDAKVIGSGPYKLTSYNKNQLVELTANPGYSGPDAPKTSQIAIKYYTGADNLKLDIQSGAIDIAWRSMTPTDISSLRTAKDVKVLTGAGGEIRYLVFDYKTMPGNSDAQKLAIRRAIAFSVDRQAVSTGVYKGTYSPLYSMIPNGVAGATEAFKTEFGAGPDKAKAASTLQQAGVKTPLSLPIEYTTDHYGPSSDLEYSEIKRQLEATGLFTVTLNSTPWTTYSKERVKDTYPIYQLGWFPDFVDGDDFLSPFLVPGNFVGAHYCDATATIRPCDLDNVSKDLTVEQTQTGAARTAAFADIQTKLATGQLPYIPLLQGEQVAVTRSDVSGVQATLDPTYQFRLWLFSKS
jgi:peptide/nickel transport system substrate-binding protein